MLLHKNGKFIIGQLKSPLLSKMLVLNRPSMSVSTCEELKQTELYLLEGFNQQNHQV